MNIETVKLQLEGDGYLVNGNMSVPNAPGNRHYQMVQEWIAAGNTPEPAETSQETTDRLAAGVRGQRDALLRASDFTQLGDAPLEPTKIGNWRSYRNSLRDVPNQAGFPETVVWPVPPA